MKCRRVVEMTLCVIKFTLRCSLEEHQLEISMQFLKNPALPVSLLKQKTSCWVSGGGEHHLKKRCFALKVVTCTKVS